MQEEKLFNKTAHTSASKEMGINKLANAPGRAYSTKAVQKASL